MGPYTANARRPTVVVLLVCRFDCVCEDGFEGVLCGVETDECSSDPCQNGATCRDQLARYDCVCAPGFTGAFRTSEPTRPTQPFILSGSINE